MLKPSPLEKRPRRGAAQADDSTLAWFREALDNDALCRPTACRQCLSEAADRLAARFREGEAPEPLVRAHAAIIDHLLISLWRIHEMDSGHIALVAVGGYGRGELHPGSDIDIMLLLNDSDPDTGKVSDFVAALWDAGLEIGHSVRTVRDCEDEARRDVTVLTTLMEARLLCGPEQTFEAMRAAIGPDRIWNSKAFFLAKRDEQTTRHRRYGDTGYNLEPNVKGSPGGLRDIQMIGWIAKRHFGATTFAELVEHDFLTPGQLERLIDCRHFLWKVRYGLHVLTGRREDRLLFDHQKNLALMLGYEDATYTLAVEQLMQRYYRTVMELSRLNEMLLQLFEEAIMLDPEASPERLDESFIVRNGYLQTADDDVFQRKPSALLELFIRMQEHPEIKGVSAWTIGLIRRSLHLIDEEFRQHPRHHRLFLRILAADRGVTTELRRMNRYGLLGLYIPAFGRIVGRMQYDLFHAYTVDEHTLFVVSNLRRFALPRFADEHPHCHRVMSGLDNPLLAYLGGLFHDIAKGRGGDHSELGAVDAEAFCREHGLSEADASLVAWLVRNHLVLSMTAQKKDIADPEVIAQFARQVGDQRHLDYLYVLTVADVRGTNPKLWNSWKSKLFQDLYKATTDALQRGPENPLEKRTLIDTTRAEAMSMLRAEGHEKDAGIVWPILSADYFLRHSPAEIVWHTRTLATAGGDLSSSIVDVRDRPDVNGMAILLYTPQIRHTFAAATAILDELGLSVQDARIIPTENGFSIDTYIVVDGQQPGKLDKNRIREVHRRLDQIIKASAEWRPRVNRKASRRLRMFDTPTRIEFREDPGGQRTMVELICADRPGLLLDVGEVFLRCGIDIKTAKIVTIGERAEDVFFVTDTDDAPLTAEQCAQLRAALEAKLA
jgi:[protein-PII] uridylyltransferase